MKSENKIYLIIAIIAMACGFGAIWYGNTTPKAKIRMAAVDAVGKDAKITVREVGSEPEYTMIRDSLVLQLSAYKELTLYKRLATIQGSEHYEIMDAISDLYRMEWGIKEVDMRRVIRATRDVDYAETFANDIQTMMLPDSVLQMRYDALSKKMEGKKSLKCLLAEVKTFIRRTQNGEYHDDYSTMYQVDIETAVGPMIDYYSTVYVTTYKNKPFPDLTKLFDGQKEKIAKYKLDHQCQ